mgnify:CR=1 FL=1
MHDLLKRFSCLLGEVVDLTNPVEDGMPYYPSDPRPVVMQWRGLERDGVNLKLLLLGSHSGTHVDAPAHFVEGGATVDVLDPMAFSGEAIVVDARGYREVPPEIIPLDLPRVVLIYTGVSTAWRRGWVTYDYPYLSREAAKLLVERGVKVVGIDSPSVDAPGAEEPVVHRILLSRNVLIVENLSQNLGKLVGRRVWFLCLPLPIRDGDGAPARALALVPREQ